MAKKDNRFRATKKATIETYSTEPVSKRKITSKREAKKAIEKSLRKVIKSVEIKEKIKEIDGEAYTAGIYVETKEGDKRFTYIKRQATFLYKRFTDRLWMVLFDDPFKLYRILGHMSDMDIQSVIDMVRIGNLNSTFYDSDGSWNPGELTVWTEDTLYEFIMSA